MLKPCGIKIFQVSWTSSHKEGTVLWVHESYFKPKTVWQRSGVMMGIHVPIRRCLLGEKRRSWSNDLNVPLIPDIAWVEVHSWKIDKTPLTIVQRNDSDSCKSACLKYPGCITAGWKRNTSDCSLHSYTRLKASMRYWIPAPEEDYFESYFTPLGKEGCCNQLY